jgi:hypothetical protein
MATLAFIRIPVCNADGVIIERVDPARARCLSAASNATVVRKRGGNVVRIMLASTADDSLEVAMRGNPRSYSHNHEAIDNPEKCWTLKRIPACTAKIFDAVILDCAA